MRIIILLTIAFTLNGLQSSMGNSWENEFDSAITAYQGGAYEQAKVHFHKVEEQIQSAELYFNLGNCYFKLNDLAPAILYYEKARKLNPADEDVVHNLELANLKTVDKIKQVPKLALFEAWETYRLGKPINYWAYRSVFWMLLSCFAIALLVVTPRRKLKQWGLYAGLFCALLSVCCIYLASHQKSYHQSPNAAIVFTPKVEVKGSPSEQGAAVFILHEGAKVFIESEDEKWFEISIASGNVGWIRKSDCKVI